jgi:hypothetical protein
MISSSFLDDEILTKSEFSIWVLLHLERALMCFDKKGKRSWICANVYRIV